MLDDLLKEKKITRREHKLFTLFNSELGYECLCTMMDETFMEEPIEGEMTGERFAFYDGRRSLLRSIKANLDKIRYLLKENNHVRPESE